MKPLAYAAALATFGALCATLSPTVQAASFDCSKAGSANEKTICSDPELSHLDDQLGRAYRRARQAASDRRSFRVASDQQWLWREQNCHDRACLLSWYQRRQRELEALVPATLADATRLPVKLSPSGPAPVPALATMAPGSAAQATAAQPAESPAQSAQPSAATIALAQAEIARAHAAALSASAAPVAPVAPAAPAVPPPAAQAAQEAVGSTPLRLRLNNAQIAGVAPAGAMPWPHYVRRAHGEYFYVDPEAADPHQLVSVRYYGIENGQYIIEAVRGDAVLRYTCSADCSYIGQLKLPGDVEKDMVIMKNDRASLPSLIVSDAVNGLLAEANTR